MQLIKMEKVKDGRYLKNYELTYENKAGKEKKYEIVSRKDLQTVSDIGSQPSGVSIIATKNNKLLLLREFRMGVNKFIYNLCAGMMEEQESIEECIKRELYEETGLKVKDFLDILPPSYSAVAISDIKTYIAFVEAEGDFEDHSSENEQIEAHFFTREEVKDMLTTEEFSSRAQLAAYFFTKALI
ncbi:MAG: NUDIX hydrolase [Lachnospiraceae bacterium]|nr:NUDIX hydrolase [Lachnospiraceae bacterium]MBQ8233055.1 NUDIX hydrolase [Lachnospiraceae bacterium]